MSTKPILFNTDMVRAILDNRKTVTRRVVKPQPYAVVQQKDAPIWCGHFVSEDGKVLIDKPPYRPGDILYVRETWQNTGSRYIYKADVYNALTDDVAYKLLGWRPSIHMPREAARIFLRVTNVYPQQLKDVTEVDVMAEGFNSRDEFIIAILEMYPDCTEDSWFWVNEFERISKEKVTLC